MKDNKLIAEFMEFHRDTEDLYLIDNYNLRSENQFQATYVREMKFHSSWDWLMPVVEKIENFGYEFIIVESRCYVKHNTDHSVEELFHIETIGSKLDTTYDAVVQFINQYNKTI
tara:strand:- start:214 stop:555 length:342 start_codon:yes stop_codon:yes gene_type:complete